VAGREKKNKSVPRTKNAVMASTLGFEDVWGKKMEGRRKMSEIYTKWRTD